MTPSTERYRRLPGRWRGFTSNASLWIGSDHILLVRSAWFREEYKRFYLRDIQAIVIAPCARFHFSIPIVLLALFWFLPGLTITTWPRDVAMWWGVGGVALAATWLAISMMASCRCRLYTAVSQEELPSLYRTWVARMVVRRLKPLIEGVQGTVDPAWVEAEGATPGPAAAALRTSAETPAEDAKVPLRRHSLAVDLFLLSVFLGALSDASVAYLNSTAWTRIRTFLTLLQLAGAIAVLLQAYRRQVGRTMQKIAIAVLVVTGLMQYAQIFLLPFMLLGVSNGKLPQAFVIAHQLAAAVRLVLGVAGAAIALRGSREQPDIIKD